MSQVIKKTLYVGLGGTGMTAILNTKKMFVDTYGEVPPMIGFLGLDTDRGAYTKSLNSKKSPTGKVTLDANEQMPIHVENPVDIYEYEKENLGWFPETNLGFLDSMVLGAGQVRSNGRFAFTVNRDRILARFQAALQRISLAIHEENEKYRTAQGPVEVAIVFSICGGTGCGTFINAAYLLKEIAPQCKISGYAVLPNVFKSMLRGQGDQRVTPNAYGAVRDLDYLMSLNGSPKCIPFDIQYFDTVQSFRKRPFDAVFFVDNRNANGGEYSNLDKLTEMISLALVTSSGALAAEAASISDNVSKEIAQGNYDVDDKVAWASGMGACEIKISHDTLEEVYSLKSAQYLLDLMSASNEDADALARSWIDSAQIRENDGNDQLIDRVLANYMADGVLDVDPESPKIMVDAYIASQKVDPNELDNTAKRILGETKASFEDYINKVMTRDGGLKTASNVITNIISQVDIFLGEMQEEKSKFSDDMTLHQTMYTTAVDDLAKYAARVLKRSGKIQELSSDVVNAVKLYVTDAKEFARRVAAISFFSQFKVYLMEWETVVEELSRKFASVYKTFVKEVGKIENKKEEEHDRASFRIDLTSRCIKKLAIRKEQITVGGFAATLKNGLVSLAKKEVTEDDVYNIVKAYTNMLGATQEFSEFTIDDVFADYSETEFNALIKSAIRKSSPLFSYSYKGRKPKGRGKDRPNDIFFIGVPDRDTNRLKQNNSSQIPYFEACVEGDPSIQFASVGLPDRVIIYRQVGVVPAYAILGVSEYESIFKEESDSCKCYIDEVLNARMEQIRFSMTPQRAADNREADQVEHWVLACIFNLIRNYKGQYQLQCSKGKMIDDRWFSLGTYRNLAFDEFKRIYMEVKEEIDQFVANELKMLGKTAADELLAKVKAGYMDEYSHLCLERKTLDGPAYALVRDLMEKELQVVEELEF